MNRIIVQLIALLISCSISAQEIQETFETSNLQSLKLHSDYPNLNIQYGKSTNGIEIEGQALFNDEAVPESVSFLWDNEKGVLHIKSDTDQFEDWKYKNKKWDKPKNDYKEKWKNGNYKYAYWDYDVKLNITLPTTVSSLHIESTYGSLTIADLPEESNVTNTYGSIKASAQGNLKHCSLTASFSSITLDIPQKLSTSLKLRSDYGEIYSDVDFDLNKEKSTNQMYKTIIVGELNKPGDNTLNLRADYGNIYLKKS